MQCQTHAVSDNPLDLTEAPPLVFFSESLRRQLNWVWHSLVPGLQCGC